MNTRRVIAALLVLLVGPTSSASAWGRDGHRLVARIAAKNLSPTAAAKVAAILGTAVANVEAAMAAAATWPDEIDKRATGTSEWHFIDGPVRAPFSLSGLCHNHDCITDRIEELERRLRTNETGFQLRAAPNPTRPMTSQELAFLIHFVGDIHQPLHAASDGDRGGNCVPLLHPIPHAPGRPTSELHAAWDVDVVDAVLTAFGNEAVAAQALSDGARTGAAIPQGTPVDWAKESNDLARSAIYAELHIRPHAQPAQPGQCPTTPIPATEVSRAYLLAQRHAAEDRLMRAGMRLAAILNEICAGDGCKALPSGRRG